MGKFNSFKDLRILYWIAIIGLNLLAIFVILNAGIWGYNKVVELKSKSNQAQKTPLRFKHSNAELRKLFPNLSQEEVDQLISDSRKITQEYDSFTQFKESPYQTRFVNVDANGFRLSKNQGPWPPNKNDFVIFFFGGSTGFGYGVPDDQTIASHLQELLNQKSKQPIRIYNFGRAYYFSSQECALFEKLLRCGYIPNMVIFLDGLNEFIMSAGEPGYTRMLKGFMQKSDTPWLKSLIKELPLIQFILNYSSNAKVQANGSSESLKAVTSTDEQQLIEQVIKRYQTNKRIIETISREFGISTVFVWQPVPVFGYDQANHIFKHFDYTQCCSLLKRGYESLACMPDFKKDENNFIWLADVQRDIKEPNYVSALHYSPKMSWRIANIISDILVARNFIPDH